MLRIISTRKLELQVGLLPKKSFSGLVRFRYGWELYRTPMYCECGSRFDIQHALSWKKGGFAVLRHNDVRNITAALLKEICHDVRVEPSLQLVKREARLDVSKCTRVLGNKSNGFFFYGSHKFT